MSRSLKAHDGWCKRAKGKGVSDSIVQLLVLPGDNSSREVEEGDERQQLVVLPNRKRCGYRKGSPAAVLCFLAVRGQRDGVSGPQPVLVPST